MHHQICLKPDRSEITKAEERSFNIFEMSVDEVRSFDCGAIVHPDFPEQTTVSSYKPLLSEVLTFVRTYSEESAKKAVKVNIEIKSREEWYGIYQPYPAELVEFVLEVISKTTSPLINIQSFDLQILKLLHRLDPTLEIAVLIEEPAREFNKFLDILEFEPQICSPQYTLLNSQLIEDCKSHNMRIIPWTVNETDDMNKLIKLGVDGIITDYPHRLLGILHN